MIVNFTLDKISINKNGIVKGTIEAKNSIKFTNVAEKSMPESMKDQYLLTFKFEYGVDYLPDIAKTEIIGYIHFLTNKEQKDKILKQWENDSKIDPELSGHLVNYVFAKCGVMALSLSQQVGLPSHIPLPKIALRKKEDIEEKKPKAS